MQLLSRLRTEISTWEAMQTRLAELHELAEMLEDMRDEDLAAEVEVALAQGEEALERQRFLLLLNGEHDAKSALVSIHAGNGRTDAPDWVPMLPPGYKRLAE